METKFLNDGRKVVVIGSINSNEYIVQEIFLTEKGDEIPSGERFTTKSLHDKPVVSYQEKERKRIEERIDSAKREYDSVNNRINGLKIKLKSLEEIYRSANVFSQNMNEAEYGNFVSLVTGNCWVLKTNQYFPCKPERLEDAIISWDTWSVRRYDGIKLISLFGKSNGDYTYQLHKYSDGSGSSYDNISVFHNYEEAFIEFKKIWSEKILDKGISEEYYSKCIESGIVFDDEIESVYRIKLKEANKVAAEKKRVEIAKLTEEIILLESSK
jgi:hypothetical protein